MGDDGHTASLFPGTAAVNEREHRVVANYAEHSTTGKSWRITMTAPFINRARQVLILVEGAGKAERVKEVLEGPRDPQRLPIQLIYAARGQISLAARRSGRRNGIADARSVVRPRREEAAGAPGLPPAASPSRAFGVRRRNSDRVRPRHATKGPGRATAYRGP